jgi:hypothetical protein
MKKLSKNKLKEYGMIVALLVKAIEKDHLDSQPDHIQATVITLLHGHWLANFPEDMREDFVDQHSEHALIVAKQFKTVMQRMSAAQRRIQ